MPIFRHIAKCTIDRYYAALSGSAGPVVHFKLTNRVKLTDDAHAASERSRQDAAQAAQAAIQGLAAPCGTACRLGQPGANGGLFRGALRVPVAVAVLTVLARFGPRRASKKHARGFFGSPGRSRALPGYPTLPCPPCPLDRGLTCAQTTPWNFRKVV